MSHLKKTGGAERMYYQCMVDDRFRFNIPSHVSDKISQIAADMHLNEAQIFGLKLKMKCVNLFTTKGNQISCNFDILTTDGEEEQVVNVSDNEEGDEENELDASESQYEAVFTKKRRLI